MEIHRIQQSHRQLGQDSKKLPAMVPQPLPMQLAGRIILGHQRPKVLAVIHLLQVAQLMDDDIINHCIWRHHQPPVEVDIAEAGAAAPAGGLVLDKEPVKAIACLLVPIGSSGRQVFISPPPIPFQQRQLQQVLHDHLFSNTQGHQIQQAS